jgi:hypothetical protein
MAKVAREVHGRHAAAAKLALERIALGEYAHACGKRNRRRCKQPVTGRRSIARVQQARSFASQTLIASAFAIEKCRTLGGRKIERAVDEPLNGVPAVGGRHSLNS